MPSRQAINQAAHRASGLCVRCTNPTWRGSFCFRCTLTIHFSKKGILKIARRSPKSWDKFVSGMMARYTRILEDEGFAFKAHQESEKLLVLAGMQWAKYKRKRQVLEIVSRFDERAIMERFRPSTGGKK